MNETVRAMQKFGEAASRAAFAVLDLNLSLTPQEDRPPVSWDVERERFMRSLPSYDPRND